MIEQISVDLSTAAASKTDEIIRSAILKAISASELVLADMAHQGTWKIYPDGREVFAYDGIDLVCFWPLEVKNGQKGDAYKLTASRKYQLLS